MLSGAQSGDFQLNPDRKKNYNEKVNKKSETKKKIENK